MSKVAEAVLTWTKSTTTNVKKQTLTYKLGETEVIAIVLDPAVGTYTVDVPEDTDVIVTVTPANDLGDGPVATLTFKVGALALPEPVTNLTYSLGAIKDVP